MNVAFRKLLGQIIRLCKSITLHEPPEGKGFKIQFIAKVPGLESLGVGPTVTLWKTEQSFRAIEAITRMISGTYPDLADCDIKTIEMMIPEAIYDLIFDKTIFTNYYILSSSQKTLADCRVDKELISFATRILEQIVGRIRKCMGQWCTVIGVPRLMCESFAIPQAGISLISRMDEKKWQSAVSSRYDTGEWSQHIGCVPNSNGPVLFGFECRSLAICENTGTQLGTKFSSKLGFAKFFALVYAVVTVEEDIMLFQAMAESYKSCIQFPSRTSSGLRIVQSSFEEAIFPFFCTEFTLSENAISRLRQWYKDLTGLSADCRSRTEKCGHFVNRGLNTIGVDSYVNYFVALDALFGIRGDVENSIQRGVQSLPLEKDFKERMRWLYELRSELVHGGSRHCAEWSDYERYVSHFRTKPEDDVSWISCAALLYAPKHFLNQNGGCPCGSE